MHLGFTSLPLERAHSNISFSFALGQDFSCGFPMNSRPNTTIIRYASHCHWGFTISWKTRLAGAFPFCVKDLPGKWMVGTNGVQVAPAKEKASLTENSNPLFSLIYSSQISVCCCILKQGTRSIGRHLHRLKSNRQDWFLGTYSCLCAGTDEDCHSFWYLLS